MNKLYMGVGAIAVAAIALLGTGLTSIDDLRVRQREVLNATVRVECSKAVGSGTIIHSGKDGTYILTNEHVIEGDVTKKNDDGSPLTNEKGQRIWVDHTTVSFKISNWVFDGERKHAWPVKVTAKVVDFDKGKDLALLKVSENDFDTPYVANPVNPTDEILQGEQVFVAGSGLGNRTFITTGLVSLTDMGSARDNMMLVSAPLISGNSGGSAFVRRNGDYRFVGVPDAIAVGTIDGKNPYGVVTMGMVIPMSTVRAFLSNIGMLKLLKTESAA